MSQPKMKRPERQPAAYHWAAAASDAMATTEHSYLTRTDVAGFMCSGVRAWPLCTGAFPDESSTPHV